MSTLASESVFLTALQPNTAVTTYALPSDLQLGGGGASAEAVRAKRVQQQVQMRLAEKTSTLPRQNGSSSYSAMSDYGGSSTMKYNTYNPGFSSKSSYMYTGSKTMDPRVSNRTDFSSRSSGADMTRFQRMSYGSGGAGGGGGGGGGGGFYTETMQMGGYQGTMRQPSRVDHDAMSVHSLRNGPAVNSWVIDGSDAGSFVSDRDLTINRRYAQSAVNGYTTQMKQGGHCMTQQVPMRRAMSGTNIYQGGAMTGGATEMMQQQAAYRGPAHRTISRLTNRNRMSMGSVSGGQMYQSAIGGDRVDQGFITSTLTHGSQGNLSMQRPGTLSRAMSIKSMHSVGKGGDVFGGQMELGSSMGNLTGFDTLDMPTAIQYLREEDAALQVLGAAYIQHQCYNENDAKNEVRQLGGIRLLVELFNNSNSQEVRRYATGAARNLIYENMENKKVLIEAGGITELVKALSDRDDELHKNITGILWNLSSKEALKEKLASETLPELTEKILIPVAAKEKEDAEKKSSESFTESPSEAEIFCNATGCLRNLSSVSDKTRQRMRETRGLVDSLVEYIQASLEKGKADEKGVENAVCVLRNLSYQLYSELPPSIAMRLEGPTRDENTDDGGTIGCFTPKSRKAKKKHCGSIFTFTEVAKEPKGAEWLWHPKIIELYNKVLKSSEINSTTREAATGALQNITAGDKRWASVLSQWSLEQQRMLPTVIDRLRTENNAELRSVTGFLRNLSRHASDKDDMATKTVSHLVEKLPDDGTQKYPSSEVVINICGIFNNLVTSSHMAARDICYFDGIGKLMGIKKSHDCSTEKLKAAKAASTVLANMYNYKKLHKKYLEKGFKKEDFADNMM